MQPKYIAITCRQCGTLMHANEIQVGQQIACPDCGSRHTVPVAPKPVVRPSVLAPDSLTPKIDPHSLPGERPKLVAHTMGVTLQDQQAAKEYERALEESQRTGRPMKLDKRGRPVLPRFPLLSGILSFLFTSGVPTRWATLTLGMVMWFIDGVPSWLFWNGSGSGAITAMGGLVETLIAAVIAIIWLAGLSSIVVAIVSQSAVGTDRIEDWPSLNFIHSMSEMLPVTVAAIFTAAPGWALGKLVFDDLAMCALLASGTMLFGMPLVLLSQLAGNYTWELVDLKVLGAMVRSPFSMLLLYLQSAILLVACAAAILFLGQKNLYLTLLATPLVAGCAIIYARLLGRLGWRLSEKIVIDEPDEEGRPAAPKNYNPPRAKKATV
jgi:DNA-directed RNA polymerase subunit RPC12/RpoP